MGFYPRKDKNGKIVPNTWRADERDYYGKRCTATFKGTKKQAHEEYVTWKKKIKSPGYIDPEKMLFASFVEDWKENRVKLVEVKTFKNYNYLVGNHILPTMGEIPMDKIKPAHINKLFNELTKKGLSSGTIGDIFTILKSLFKQAHKWGYIEISPMDKIEKKDVVKTKDVGEDINPFSIEETKAILHALKQVSDHYAHWKMLIKLAFETGMRRGELLALEWKHVDLENSVIDVQQSYNIIKSGVPLIKEPKTKAAKRLITISKSMVEELKKYRSMRWKERQDIREAWRGGQYDLVFSHPNGRAFTPEALGNWFTKFLNTNGFRHARFHDIRHTHATHLISKGVDIKTVSARLGHRSPSVTLNTYAHFLRSADQAAADLINDLYDISIPQG